MRRLGMMFLVLVLVTGAAVFVLGPRLPGMHFAIIGYDGPEATIVDVIHDYSEGRPEVSNIGTSAYVDPNVIVASGVRAELMAAPNVLSYEDLDPALFTREGVEYEGRVQKVKCTMEVTLQTFRGGMMAIHETTFWIQVRQNAMSVFSSADTSAAYIVNVYTTEKATVVGMFDPQPLAGGYDFPLTSVEDFEEPTWMAQQGYDEDLDGFSCVRFPVTALGGAPQLGLFLVRIESSATIHIGLDVILFGEWRETKDNRDWDWPLPVDWIPLIAFALLGIFLTVIILWRMPNRLGLAAVAVVWVVVALVIFGFSGAISDLIGGLLDGTG